MALENQKKIAEKILNCKYEYNKSPSDRMKKEIKSLEAKELIFSEKIKGKSYTEFSNLKVFNVVFYLGLFYFLLTLLLVVIDSMTTDMSKGFYLIFIMFTGISAWLLYLGSLKNSQSKFYIVFGSLLSFNMFIIFFSALSLILVRRHPYLSIDKKQKKEIEGAAEKLADGVITLEEYLKV